jgi:AraC family transcriptional regulator
MASPSRTGAPDLAPGPTAPATIASPYRLHRIERPSGAITIAASPEAAFVVRINLLARQPLSGARRGAQLKQCIAPDLLMVAAPGKAITMPGHMAQSVLVLHAAPGAFEVATGLDVADIAGPIHGQALADGLLTGLVERLFDVSDSDTRLAQSLFQALCLALVEHARVRGSRTQLRGGLTESQLTRLRTHVEARLEQPLPISELAALAGLSPFHFARAFKTSMGLAPASWIRLRRLTVGQRLLQDTTMSIADVAAAVGYDSPSRFSRAFRAMTGETPSQYRRRAGSKGSVS